jgi:hypothetical protein
MPEKSIQQQAEEAVQAAPVQTVSILGAPVEGGAEATALASNENRKSAVPWALGVRVKGELKAMGGELWKLGAPVEGGAVATVHLELSSNAIPILTISAAPVQASSDSYTPEELEEIKQEALKSLEADSLDLPENHLAYVRKKITAGLARHAA